MQPMPAPIPPTPCQCVGSRWVPTASDCMCEDAERALRAWMRGSAAMPMTTDQREWALAEIGSVEGYSRSDYEGGDDAMIAGGVLDAWTDFCRDKGLL